MFKQLKNILNQDRSSFPYRQEQAEVVEEEEEDMYEQQIVDPQVYQTDFQEEDEQQHNPQVYHHPEHQYFVNTNMSEPIVTVSEKISELEKSNSNLHSKIDNLTVELQNFRKDFASFISTQFQELKQKLFAASDNDRPKSVKFAIDDDVTNPRKRPSSDDDQQQPATKKPASDDTVAFSHKFIKVTMPTKKKKKDLNVVQDLILVLVWIMKLSRLIFRIFNINNLSEMENTNSSIYAVSFARCMKCLTEGLTGEEEALIQSVVKVISTENLQKFKTGSSFCNSDKTKQILDTKPALFTDDYDFGKMKLTKISYVSTLLGIFTKHGITISQLFRAMIKSNKNDRFLIFKKLQSVLTAFKYVTELGNLACICTHCKTRVVDVFCDSCMYMSACSVCYNKIGYVECAVCKAKMSNVKYGYNTKTPINSSDKSTSVLYSSSVRTIPRIQVSTKNFSSKHKTSGLVGKTCDSELKSNDDTTKAFVLFVTSVERSLMKSLGAVETFLNQGKSNGLRLCDSCRSTVATKRLRYKPSADNKKETIIAVCDGCFDDKTDNSTEDSPFIKFSRDNLYRGANMSLTAAAMQLNLSAVPLDSRHQGYFKNKRINANAVCSKYNIDAQSKSQEDSILTLKTVLKQIVSWGADKDHDMKTYFNHVNKKMSRCWPVNNNHLIEIFIKNDEIQTRREEVNYELFFSQSDRNLIQPQSHEKDIEQPHPYVKQILQILKVEDDDNNKKASGLKTVLKESDVCVCNESVIVIGKLFNRLESSKLLSDLDDEDCQIVGFYNKEFHPHPMKKTKRKQKSTTSSKKSKKSSAHEEEDLDLLETLTSD